jgi:predicted phage tail protein
MIEKKYTIYLHGKLAKRWGTRAIELWGSSLRSCVQGLCANFGEEFKNTIRNGNWHVTTNSPKPIPSKTDTFLLKEDLDRNLTDDIINIYPEVVGAGGRPGVMGIILGVLMIVVAIFAPYIGGPLLAAQGALYVGGAFAIIGGAITMLTTKTPKMGNYQGAEQDRRASFVYNGPVNVVEQGGPVPLVYGRHICGSTVISAGIEVLQL